MLRKVFLKEKNQKLNQCFYNNSNDFRVKNESKQRAWGEMASAMHQISLYRCRNRLKISLTKNTISKIKWKHIFHYYYRRVSYNVISDLATDYYNYSWILSCEVKTSHTACYLLQYLVSFSPPIRSHSKPIVTYRVQ